VRFTERRISLLTLVSQLRHSRTTATTTVADAATIVVVVAVAVAETTISNCYSTIYDEGMTEKSSLFCIFAVYSIVCTYSTLL
jgi:hypothetical protein